MDLQDGLVVDNLYFFIFFIHSTLIDIFNSWTFNKIIITRIGLNKHSKKFHKNLQQLWHPVHRKLTTSLRASYIYDLNKGDLKIHYFCLWVQGKRQSTCIQGYGYG